MSAPKKPLNLAVKPLAAAVTVASALMLASQAQAVNVAQDGLGEVLLFPYYTVNNSFDTNINITNTSENTVIFKIRFREAHNSRDARDFNVVLSPFDVWTARVTMGTNGVARLETADMSCTVGQLPTLANGNRGIDFTNFDYTGINADQGPTGLDRTLEGHIEVIQMAVQYPTNGGQDVPSSGLTFPSGSVGYNAQHVAGVPRNCGAVATALGASNVASTAQALFEPINVLKGSLSLIKVSQGKAIAVDPTVLANFYNPDSSGVDGDGAAGSNLLFSPASQDPQLNQTTPQVAELFDDTIGAPIFAFMANPEDAVSAVLSRKVVVNQYSVNPAVGAQTDWVVSFPTKYFYVDERETASNSSLAPFNASDTFQNPPLDCAAVNVGFRFFSREEDEQIIADPGFSPPPPQGSNAICYETQVITFDNGNVFGSPLAVNVDVASAGYKNGWMRLEFPDAGALVGSSQAGNTTFTGLPIIGFAATTLENGSAGSFVLNYGMGWSHGYVTDITPPLPR